MSLVKKWNGLNLVLRIGICLVIGVFFGITLPGFKLLDLFGLLFVGALKAIAPILVFLLILSSFANANSDIGKKFKTVIGLYLFSTLMAAVVAVTADFIFKPTLVLVKNNDIQTPPPAGLWEIFNQLLLNLVDNPVHALSTANYLGILMWSIVIGLLMNKICSAETKKIIKDLSNLFAKVIQFIINMAPFGIMGLVFTSVSKLGVGVFVTYGKLLLILIGCMIVVALIVNPAIVAVMLRMNPYPLVWHCIRESGVTAFFTRSSAANIPVNLELCRRLGLDPDMYSVSIPLGSTINMNGAAITITTLTLAAAHTLGSDVGLFEALLLSILATFAACGASGVAGGSLLLIPMACGLFGIDPDIAIQVVGVGFIISFLQDSFETALNSSGDALFTSASEFYEWKKQGKKIDFKLSD